MIRQKTKSANLIIHKAASNLEEAKEAECRSEKGNKYALTLKDKHVKDINGNIETPEMMQQIFHTACLIFLPFSPLKMTQQLRQQLKD